MVKIKFLKQLERTFELKCNQDFIYYFFDCLQELINPEKIHWTGETKKKLTKNSFYFISRFGAKVSFRIKKDDILKIRIINLDKMSKDKIINSIGYALNRVEQIQYDSLIIDKNKINELNNFLTNNTCSCGLMERINEIDLGKIHQCQEG